MYRVVLQTIIRFKFTYIWTALYTYTISLNANTIVFVQFMCMLICNILKLYRVYMRYAWVF